MDARTKGALRHAFAVYALWVGATYLLEGLPGTLLRPDAAGLRLAYSIVANLGIGIALPLWILRGWVRAGLLRPAELGFSRPSRVALSVLLGAAAGYALFHTSAQQRLHPLVLVNGFAQTWVVSVAEILVCWGLLGGAVLGAVRSSRAGAYAAAAVTASLSFGLYHFAHSAPFNQPEMVAFLCGIGLVTSAWWFISREVYGTAVFHNFFALTGVVAALAARRLIPGEPALAIPSLAVAAAALLLLLLASSRWMRRT